MPSLTTSVEGCDSDMKREFLVKATYGKKPRTFKVRAESFAEAVDLAIEMATIKGWEVQSVETLKAV